MFKIISRIGKKWWLFVVMLITISINVFMDFLLPLQLGAVISDIQSVNLEPPFEYVVFDCIWMLLIAGLSGVSAILTCKLSSIATAHIVSVTRYELFKEVGEFSLNEMNKFSVSSLVTRATNDLTFIADTLNLFFRFILYGPALSIAAMISLGITASQTRKIESMYVVWAILGAVLLMVITIIIVIKIVMPKYEAIQEKLDKVALVSRENLEGLRVVRAYNTENYQEEKFSRVNNTLMKTESFSNRGLGLLTPFVQTVICVLNVMIYFIGSKLIPQDTMKYASLSVIIQYAALILAGFIMIIAVVIQIPRCIVCSKRVNEVIATLPAVVGSKTTPETSEVGTIEFRNVTFAYPGAEKPVIENVSFKVNKGETIAFIGATGSGKTTLINLLPRFFDCTEGEVLVDGINVKDYKLEDLNAKFGYVPQKGYLFHASLKDNVTIGRKNATPVEIKRALDIAQASEFVSKLPGGLDYEISQGGKNVSGGQRQRLCIARAIIMQPEIFIFDDSFSALDYRTDKVLRGEIKAQCEGTTNVIVGQRVGTIMGADQIVVLDEGKVAGIGTHRELLQTCDVYKEIALSQLSKEELENGTK